MKTILNGLMMAAFLFEVSLCEAQPDRMGSSASPVPNITTVGYQVGERDANQQIWQKIVKLTDAAGRVSYKTNQAYVQLGSGLNYQDSSGQWQPSREEIDAYQGGAIAQYGQHKVIFANNLNTAGAIDLQTPDGKELQSDIIGLSYYDTASGKSVLIARIKDSQGQIVNSNQIVYPDAFAGVAANVRYTYTKAGLEQDVVLLAQPPRPEAFGLSSSSSVLQILTEFTSSPAPTINILTNGPDANGALADEWLDFGAMKMIPGRAFLLGSSSPAVPVSKQWMNMNGRTVLVESVPLPAAAGALLQLPAVAQANLKAEPDSVQYVVSNRRLLPPRLNRKETSGEMEIARSSQPSQGFVLDYIIVNGTQPANYTFKGDTTYEISGTVTLSGATKFEPGTILKYTPGAEITFSFSSTIQCQGTAYHPIVFTARDDDSIGETPADSTHTISGSYASYVLSMGGPNLSSASYFRVLYASTGMFFYGGSPVISNAQFVDCQQAFKFQFSPITVYNALFDGVTTVFDDVANYYSSVSCTVQSTTFANVNCIYANGGGSLSTPGMSVVNSIVANVNEITSGGSISLSGSYNGFYDSPTFGTSTFSSSSNPFVSAGGGNYYLATTSEGGDASGFRGKGKTSGISSTVLADLKTKTTYPPQVLNGQTISSDNFTAQVPRDSESPGPDLGYHYDALDYIFQNCLVESSMTFLAGTAVGWQGQALYFSSDFGGNSITFNGEVGSPCYFVRCNTVQESDSSGDDTGIAGSGQWPYLYSTFTRFSAMGDIADYFDANATYENTYNCEFWAGLIGGDINGGLSLVSCNCLFDRAYVDLDSSESSSYGYLSLQNCTFHGGTLTLDNLNYETYAYIYDSAFDGTTINVDDPDSGSTFSFSYNAYDSGANTLPGDSSDTTVSSFNWQTGPLGAYYLPTSSALIGAGNEPATYISVPTGYNGNWTTLADFTTDPVHQTPDDGSMVNIGYHYATLVANNGTFQLCPNTASSPNSDTFNFSQFDNGWNDCSLDQWGLPVTYTEVAGPADGSLSRDSWNGCEYPYTYTPTLNYIGYDTFTYKMSDSLLASQSATVTVTVGDPNPQANPQTAMTGIGQSLNLTLSGSTGCSVSLANAIVSGEGPTHGTLSGTLPNVTYQPTAGYEGIDTFQFTTSDGPFVSSPATVTIYDVGGPALTAQCVESGPGIQLNWTLDSAVQEMETEGLNIMNFIIYRASSASGPYNYLDTVSASQTSYDDATAAPGTTYYYIVTFEYQDPDTGTIYVNSTSNPTSTPPTPGVAPYSNEASYTACEPPTQGTNGVDVVFILDNTGSIWGNSADGTLTPYQDAIENSISYIQSASGGNCRFALVSPDTDGDTNAATGADDGTGHDMVDVRIGLTSNIADFESALNDECQLNTSTVGGDWPESTDECLNTVVSELAAAGRQNTNSCTPPSSVLQLGNFTGTSAFRTNAVKLVVIFTDAEPGGFCDPNTYYPSDPEATPNEAHAHTYALSAGAQHISINAIELYDGDDGDIDQVAQTVMEDYSTSSCGWYDLINYDSSSGAINQAILNMLYTPGACH